MTRVAFLGGLVFVFGEGTDSVPGCYVRAPSGCPLHPEEAIHDGSWILLGESLAENTCRQQRRLHFNAWCGISDAETHFVRTFNTWEFWNTNISENERSFVHSFRHFDYFEGDVTFPWAAKKPQRVRGWVGAGGGLFVNSFGTCAEGAQCLSEELCCRADPAPGCFDGVYFTPYASCDTSLAATESNPEEMLYDHYNVLGIEQTYQRITARRLEHLTSLALPLWNRRVLELGARTGDLTHYFTDRECNVTVVEPRHINLLRMRKRLVLGHLFPNPERVKVVAMDLERSVPRGKWDVVFCYGLLYHLSQPEHFLRRVAKVTSDILLLETEVSNEVQELHEPARQASMAFSGRARRLPRENIFQVLKSVFPYVYMPATQPNHDEFPIDWHGVAVGRAVFIASQRPLSSRIPLLEEVPMRQSRTQ